MPFKSQAQRRFLYAAEARGEVPKGTAGRWQKETGEKKLPEKVKTAAFVAGVEDVFSRLVMAGDPHSFKLASAGPTPSEDTRILTMQELLAVKDPAERKRYLADMSAKNHRVAMAANRPSSTRSAVVTQSKKGA